MAEATEILSYRGDAALGLGGSGTQSFGNVNLDFIQQSQRELGLQAFQASRDQWMQKIKDRDTAYKMIDDDELIPTDILERHRPIVDEKLKAVEEYFMKNNGDVVSDPKKFREYQRLVSDAKLNIKQGQKWFIAEKDLLDSRSKMTNPTDVKEVDDYISKQNGKGFWSLPMPYQKNMPFKLEVVASPSLYKAPVQKTEGLNKIEETELDVQGTFDKYTKLWTQRENIDQFNQYVNTILSRPDADAFIKNINDRLKAKGIEEIKFENGAFLEPPDRIAAKITLAGAEQKVRKVEFDKQRADYYNDAARIKIAQGQLGLETQKFNFEKKKIEEGYGKNAGAYYNSALVFAGSIMNNLNSIAGQDGIIDENEMYRITDEEKNFMASPTYDKNQLSLNKLNLGPGTRLRKDGNNWVLEKKSGDKFTPVQTIDMKQVAGTRLAYEMQNTQGKEGFNWNEIVNSYMGAAKQNEQQQQQQTIKKGDVVDGYEFLGGDPNNQNNWRKK